MSTQGKLIFIFVAGVEGCGHHGLNPVISDAYAHSTKLHASNGAVVREWRALKGACNWLWCRPNIMGLTHAMARRRLTSLIAEQARMAREQGQVRVVLEDNSFPAGKHRNIARQWRIAELCEIVRPYADEIYVLGLYRHPIASTFSHKDWDGGMEQHARLLRDYLVYVNAELAAVTDPRLVVHYEDLIENQAQIAPRLAAYFGLATEDFEHGLRAIRPSKKNWRVDVPAADQATLKNIFSAAALDTWPLLAHAERASGSPLEH
jgi:hypothetical protein